MAFQWHSNEVLTAFSQHFYVIQKMTGKYCVLTSDIYIGRWIGNEKYIFSLMFNGLTVSAVVSG